MLTEEELKELDIRVDSYLNGLMASEMRVYGFKVIHEWANRYRVGMGMEMEKRKKGVQAEKGVRHDCCNACG